MASVNYLKTINTFWDEAPYLDGFSSDAATLFFAVLDTINSSSSNSNWQKTPITYDRLISKTRIGKRAYLSARSWLVQYKFLIFEAGKNEYSPAKYFVHQRFIDGGSEEISISSEKTKTDQDFEQTPESKKEKPRKEIQKEPPKKWGDYKEGTGDGELHSLMSEFYLKNKEKYDAEMYQEFLRYWTALVQKGKDKGKELWRTQTTFSIAGRLATWAKNYKPKSSDANSRKQNWNPSETLDETLALIRAKEYLSTG